MRIDHVYLENFRGFREVEVDLEPRCTVLAGVNGSGKSSLLDGLAVAAGAWFLGFDEITPRSIVGDEVRRERIVNNGHVDLEPQYPVRVRARGRIDDRTLTWIRELRRSGGNTTYGGAADLREVALSHQRSVQEGSDTDLPVMAYYGTGRLWRQKRASKQKRQGLSSRTQGYQDCLDPESNHKLFEAWMRQREQARLQRIARGLPQRDVEDVLLDAVSRTAARCLEGGERFFFDVGSDELRLVFDDGREQSFALLSDGYRNLIALAADVAWRAVRLNTHMGSDAPQQVHGTVLIDEIELHLHPGWQRTVLARLQEAFPHVQFVVTTHSPQVIASVPASSVRFLDDSGRVHRVGVAEGLDTNTVLRDLMSVPERPPEYAERLERVSDLIDRGKLDLARTELDALAEKLGPDDPAITGLEWELADAFEHEQEVS